MHESKLLKFIIAVAAIFGFANLAFAATTINPISPFIFTTPIPTIIPAISSSSIQIPALATSSLNNFVKVNASGTLSIGSGGSGGSGNVSGTIGQLGFFSATSTITSPTSGLNYSTTTRTLNLVNSGNNPALTVDGQLYSDGPLYFTGTAGDVGSTGFGMGVDSLNRLKINYPNDGTFFIGPGGYAAWYFQGNAGSPTFLSVATSTFQAPVFITGTSTLASSTLTGTFQINNADTGVPLTINESVYPGTHHLTSWIVNSDPALEFAWVDSGGGIHSKNSLVAENSNVYVGYDGTGEIVFNTSTNGLTNFNGENEIFSDNGGLKFLSQDGSVVLASTTNAGAWTFPSTVTITSSTIGTLNVTSAPGLAFLSANNAFTGFNTFAGTSTFSTTTVVSSTVTNLNSTIANISNLIVGSINNLQITNNGGNTLNIANGKTVTFTNSVNFQNHDGNVYTLPNLASGGGGTVAGLEFDQTFTGLNSFAATTTLVTTTINGDVIISPGARSSFVVSTSSPTLITDFRFNVPSHTNVPANGFLGTSIFNINGGGASTTIQFTSTTPAFSTVSIISPTLSSASLVTTTITNPASLVVVAPPLAGSKVTFVNPLSVQVQSGLTELDGGLTVVNTTTTLATTTITTSTITSSSIASGNIGALNVTSSLKLPTASVTNVFGGTGQDSSAWNGIVQVSTGTWSVSTSIVYYQAFTASGTWTKPANVKYVKVRCVAAGGGGGGGDSTAAVGARSGGGGAGGGDVQERTFLASDLSSSEIVTIGAGGTVGAGQAAAIGLIGGTGGNTTFGTRLTCFGGGGGSPGLAAANSGAGGGGSGGAGVVGGSAATLGGAPASTAGIQGISGQGSGGGVSASGTPAEWGGAAGGGSSILANSSAGGTSLYGCGGGGGGGSITVGTALLQPGAGGGTNTWNSVGGGGGAAGGSAPAPSGGSDGATGSTVKCGAGGGGGGSTITALTNGGNGGQGGAPGGGGGGGGSANGATGGSGGIGGRGELDIWSF